MRRLIACLVATCVFAPAAFAQLPGTPEPTEPQRWEQWEVLAAALGVLSLYLLARNRPRA